VAGHGEFLIARKTPKNRLISTNIAGKRIMLARSQKSGDNGMKKA